jgi:hypothetical protein
MDAHDPATDPLLARFSGKRRWERTALRRPVLLVGEGAAFEAALTDLSEGGALVDVTDEAFYGDEDGLSLVRRTFPAGLEIRVGTEEAGLRAQVVRILPQETGRLALGCRFERPLATSEFRLLGASCAGEAPRRGSASRPARPHRPLFVLLFGGDLRVAGPLLVSDLVGLSPGHLLARLAGGPESAESLRQRLGGTALHARVLRGRREYWSGPVRLLAVEAAGPDWDLCLETGAPPGRSLRRGVRAASTA